MRSYDRRHLTHPNPNPNQTKHTQVEGLYKHFGDLAPLKELVALKKKYCYRLYLDQTFSFGTFGATGTKRMRVSFCTWLDGGGRLRGSCAFVVFGLTAVGV